MRIVAVRPYRFYQHNHSDRRASIWGAGPWTGAPGNTKDDWTLTEKGWTWEVVDSRGNTTFGLGRKAAETKEEAEKVMKNFNAK